MEKRVFIAGLLTLISGMALIKAQVTIGSGIPPGNGALLELKEREPEPTDISTADKGMLFPRVKLSSLTDLFPMFKPDPQGGGYLGETKSEVDISHTGLVVYNTNNVDFSEGLHFWDGKKWQLLSAVTAILPDIGSLVCGSVTMTNNRLEKGRFFETVMKITYLDGNGGSYPGTEPQQIGSSVFYIERLGGTLAVGQGEVSYRISGQIPASYSFETYTIDMDVYPIEFLGKPYCEDIVIGQEVATKNAQYRRITIPITSTPGVMATQSEMTFGNLMFKVDFLATDYHPQAVRPLIKPIAGLNVHVAYWFKKVADGNAFLSIYGRIPMEDGNWYLLANWGSSYPDDAKYGEKNVVKTNETYVNGCNSVISATTRNIAEATILIQKDDMRELYHVIYNAHTAIAAQGNIDAVPASVTIFVEKWD